MKAKKILTALLAAIMTVTAVMTTGCSGGNSEEDAANTTSTRKIVTLNMYIMTEEETDPEVAKKVQMEINRILLPEYKTMLKINYLTADEYWDALESTQEAVAYYRENGQELVKEDVATETPEGEAAEGENTEDTAAEGETPVEGEEVQPEASEGEAAEGETAEGEVPAEGEETPAEGEEQTEGEEEPEQAESEVVLDENGEPVEEVLESDGTVKGTSDLTFNELIDFIFDSEDITLTKPQLDIFIVDDYDKYVEMAKNGELAVMDEYLSYDSKVLKQYIHPTVLSSARIGRNVFGIPTNTKVGGEFTYFVFNKDLLDKYGYEVSDLTIYSELGEYLAKIKAGESVWPISGPCDIAGAEYYGNTFLTVSRQFNVVGRNPIPKFMEQKYIDNVKANAQYKSLGYYPATPVKNGRYAIEIVKTSELLEHEWNENGTNYAAYLYDVDRVTGEEAFKSAMCISSLTTNTDRAMEIITLFNTNEELANLLQFGISGENYLYDEETNTISMLNNTYMMNTLHTGNTYIKYRLPGEENFFEDAKRANLNSAPSSYLGFDPGFTDISEKSVYECVVTLCDAASKAIENGADADKVIDLARRELIDLGCIYINTTDLGGIFGKFVTTQSAQAEIIASSFKISEEVRTYNDYYGLVLEEVVEEEAAEVTEEENVEGETAEDGTVAEETDAEGAETEAEQTEEAAE